MKRRRWRLLLIPLVLLIVFNVFKVRDNDELEVIATLDQEEREVMERRAPKLKDGIYTAYGDGFSDEIHVEMIVENGEIQSLHVYDHNEHQTNGSMAIHKLPTDILEAQSVGVDVVSGATITSKGIIEATKNCIRQAGGNPADF